MDLQRVLIEIHEALLASEIEHALSATPRTILGRAIRVVDASDLIGLKVQASSNDPRRRHADLADIARLLDSAEVDLSRVREYFRLFDREKEFEALLAERTR